MVTRRAPRRAAVFLLCFLFLAAAPGPGDGVAGRTGGSVGVAWADDFTTEFRADPEVVNVGDTVVLRVMQSQPGYFFIVERGIIFAVHALYFEAEAGVEYEIPIMAVVPGFHDVTLVAFSGDRIAFNYTGYSVVGDL